MAERLLDHHPPPAAPLGVRKAAPLELLHHGGELIGRDREVERVVPAGAPLGVKLFDAPGQLVERLVIVERTGHEPDALAELLPHRVAERRARVLLDRLVRDLGEILVGPIPAGKADEGESRWQQPPVGQVVDGRHQLLTREVPGHAEHDKHARPGHPGNTPIPRIAQRVGQTRGSLGLLRDGAGTGREKTLRVTRLRRHAAPPRGRSPRARSVI
jgi:hypothetical protein